MIIAEIGLNHMGSLDMGLEYVDVLKDTDVDGITFQIREKEYYEREEKSMFKLYEEDYYALRVQIKKAGKKFGIAIADVDYIDYLENIGVDFYKIIRNDITNEELTEKLISTGKKIIVSTGLSSDEDIDLFMEKYGKNENIVLNHTQLSYDYTDCNLSAINKLQEKYNCKVSYGSHCENSLTLYMSLCYEPSDILFYVKGRGIENYPDSKHAINLDAVRFVSSNLKNLKGAIGTGVKQKMINKIEENK